MTKDKLISILGKEFFKKLGLSYKGERKYTFVKSVQESVTVESLAYLITNEIQDEQVRRTMQVEFIEYSDRPGVYIDVCWYRKPACRMVCCSDKLADRITDLSEKTETIENIIEYALKLVQEQFRKN
jgi:hypothetical protein